MTKMTKMEALRIALTVVADADARAVYESMIAQLEKRAAAPRKASSKPSARQIENGGVKEQIVALLSEGAKTIPQLMDGIVVDSELTSQRVSALLTQLKNEGAVVRNEGRIATFSLIATPVDGGEVGEGE